jgi:uncharacterized membrane protein (UPF0127 family)
VLGHAIISVRVLSGIFMLFLVTCIFMLTATAAAQSNNNDTDPVLKAIQEASPTNNRYLKAKVTVKGFELIADIPITGEQMSKGLAVKNHLNENEAMLFVFEKPDRHSFWLKDMKFPIDILGLDSDGKVVYIKENMQPCISTIICILYTPNTDSQYMLETVAGFTPRHNVSVGTNIDFELVR